MLRQAACRAVMRKLYIVRFAVMCPPPPVADDARCQAAHQLLARAALRPDALALGRLEIREPSLFASDGTSATLRHYVQVFDVADARLVDLRYATWRLDLDADGGWRVADHAEVAAGDERALAFLADGLRADTTRAVGPAAADHSAVRGVLAGYGLAADAGDADLVGDLYTIDAEVRITGDQTYHGRSSMAAMIGGEFHRSLLPWAGHAMGPAMVWTDGDTAFSAHIGRTYGPPPKDPAARAGWRRRPFRYSVNRWELRRGTDGQWRVALRDSLPVPGPRWRRALAQAVTDMGTFNQRAGSPTGAGETTDAALSTITAAAFALTIGTASAGRWPFAAHANLTIDGQDVDLSGSSVTGRLCGRLSCAGVLPTLPIVRWAADRATACGAVISYVVGERGRVEPLRIDIAKWTLNRCNGHWVVGELTMAAADSAAGMALVREANDG